MTGPRTSPIFVGQAPLATGTTTCLQVATANTNLDGSGTLGTLITAAADGFRLDGINFKAAETTTAGMLRIFYGDGSTIRLIDEVTVNAITPSSTVQAFQATWIPSHPIFVAPSDTIQIGTHNAEDFNCLPIGSGHF